MALCDAMCSQNLMDFFFSKKRLWHYFFLKFEGFEKKLWHYVALCGIIFSQNLIFKKKKRLWHYFFLKFEGFEKKIVALCDAMWRYLFSKFDGFFFFKKSAVALFFLKI